MQHVDEGTLNAWLDGQIDDAGERAQVEEHLGRCAGCRAAMEQARAIRERAISLLAAAAPSESVRPAFDELLALASAAGTARVPVKRRGGWWVPATWAASVTLALGLGWAAREIALQGSHLPGEADVQAVTRDAGAPATDEPGVTNVAEAGESPAAPAPPRAAETVPPAPAVAAPPTPEVRAREEVASDRLRVEPQAAIRQMTVQTERAAGATAGVTPPPSSAAPAPPPGALDVQPRPQLEMLEVGAAVAAWQAMARTEAAARSGMPLYGIDGLEPARTELSEDGAAVRTVYLLASGDTVELVQRRDAGGAAALSPETGQRSMLLRRRAFGAMEAPEEPPVHVVPVGDGMRVTLRGAGGTAELAQLAARLRVE